MPAALPKLPTNVAAWILTALGLLSLVISILASVPLAMTITGQTHVSPGGGEYMVGLFFALPLLLLCALLLGICTLCRKLRSMAALAGFGLSALGLVLWVAAFILDGLK